MNNFFITLFLRKFYGSVTFVCSSFSPVTLRVGDSLTMKNDTGQAIRICRVTSRMFAVELIG